jgi:hypothetical protein
MDTYDTKAKQRLEKFLQPLEFTDCLIYRGSGSEQRISYRTRFRKNSGRARIKPQIEALKFRYRDKLLAPQRVTYGLAHGVDPRTIRKPFAKCGNPLCCNADHLLPAGDADAIPKASPVTIEIADRILAHYKPGMTQSQLDDIVAGKEADPDQAVWDFLEPFPDYRAMGLDLEILQQGYPDLTQNHLDRWEARHGLV